MEVCSFSFLKKPCIKMYHGHIPGWQCQDSSGSNCERIVEREHEETFFIQFLVKISYWQCKRWALCSLFQHILRLSMKLRSGLRGDNSCVKMILHVLWTILSQFKPWWILTLSSWNMAMMCLPTLIFKKWKATHSIFKG